MLLTARYVLPVATPHIEYGAVLVRDDKIVEIGDFEHLRALHPDEPVRDFGLAALLPGFVDLHTHLEYTAMRGLVDDLPYSEWKLQLLQKERLFTQPGLGRLGAARRARGAAVRHHHGRRHHRHRRVGPRGAGGRAARLIYREVATMDKSQVEPGDAAAPPRTSRRGGRRATRRASRSASRRTRRTRATRSCSGASPSTRRTARPSPSTSPAVARSTSS